MLALDADLLGGDESSSFLSSSPVLAVPVVVASVVSGLPHTNGTMVSLMNTRARCVRGAARVEISKAKVRLRRARDSALRHAGRSCVLDELRQCVLHAHHGDDSAARMRTRMTMMASKVAREMAIVVWPDVVGGKI